MPCAKRSPSATVRVHVARACRDFASHADHGAGGIARRWARLAGLLKLIDDAGALRAVEDCREACGDEAP